MYNTDNKLKACIGDKEKMIKKMALEIKKLQKKLEDQKTTYGEENESNISESF